MVSMVCKHCKRFCRAREGVVQVYMIDEVGYCGWTGGIEGDDKLTLICKKCIKKF